MITASIIIYVICQLLIGVWVSRRVSNQEDFIVAGRSLGFGLATLTIFSTWFGAESIVGSAGAVYEDGLGASGPDPFGYAVALVLMGIIFARALWSGGFLTLGDLFRREFGPNVERLGVLLILPGPVIWGGAQIRAFGKVVSAVTDLDVNLAITIAAVSVIGYTMLGGLYASALTDFIQGIVMILGLVLLMVCILWSAEPAQLHVDPSRTHLFHVGEGGWLELIESWSIPIFSTFVAVELISRILATRNIRVAQRATIAGGLLYLLIGLLPVMMGLLAPQLLSTPLIDGEQVIPALAAQYLIFPEFAIPHLIYIILMGAIISAILSTVDSVLLSGASILSNNFLVRALHLTDDISQLRCTQISVGLLGLIAYVCALYADRIKELVEIASSFGSAGLFPVVCFGLFSQRGGPKAAGVAMILGLIGWLAGIVFNLSAPYTLSVLISTIGYIIVAKVYGETRSKKTQTIDGDIKPAEV